MALRPIDPGHVRTCARRSHEPPRCRTANVCSCRWQRGVHAPLRGGSRFLNSSTWTRGLIFVPLASDERRCDRMPTAAQAKILTRRVPAFSTQAATQKHVRVQPLPRPEAYRPRHPSKPTAFRRFYERGDFPIALEFDTFGHKIAWKVGQVLRYIFSRGIKFCLKSLI